MVNADSTAGATATRIPSGVVDIPVGRNLVLDLHEQEVGAVEVVALDVI